MSIRIQLGRSDSAAATGIRGYFWPFQVSVCCIFRDILGTSRCAGQVSSTCKGNNCRLTVSRIGLGYRRLRGARICKRLDFGIQISETFKEELKIALGLRILFFYQ